MFQPFIMRARLMIRSAVYQSQTLAVRPCLHPAIIHGVSHTLVQLSLLMQPYIHVRPSTVVRPKVKAIPTIRPCVQVIGYCELWNWCSSHTLWVWTGCPSHQHLLDTGGGCLGVPPAPAIHCETQCSRCETWWCSRQTMLWDLVF